jgi:predicted DNA-binding protein (MmcQ/YjbR family)
MPPSNLVRLRKICLALPEATEVESWGTPTFRIGKLFAMYAAPDSHHGDGREGVWVKSKHFTQDLLVRGMPHRYFVPAYVGPSGWTGVYLDRETDWNALADLLRDAYRLSASKKLAKLLDEPDAGDKAAAPPRRAGRAGRAKKRAVVPRKKTKRSKMSAKARAK